MIVSAIPAILPHPLCAFHPTGKRVVRCNVGGFSVDISRNSPAALVFAAFIECSGQWADAAILSSPPPPRLLLQRQTGSSPESRFLLKRSVLLLKAWLETSGAGFEVLCEGSSVWGVAPQNVLDSGAGGLSAASLVGECVSVDKSSPPEFYGYCIHTLCPLSACDCTSKHAPGATELPVSSICGVS